MVDYTGTSLYGDYNPYSATNLQGGYNSASGLMSQQTPFDRVILESNGGGEGYGDVSPDGYRQNDYGLTGNEGGRLAEQRVMNQFGLGDVANVAKSALTGGFNPSSYLSAAPDSMYAAAGVEKPEGFTGWASSKIPGIVGSLALGPVGGLMGGMLGTPFADAVGDALDTRTNESVRDDIEGSQYGQIGGRRAYADLKDSLKGQEMLGADSVQAALDSMNARAQMQVGTPEQMAANVADAAQLQAFNNAMMNQQQMKRPTHQWGIDPFGGMSAQMQANLADKYGTGWTRDENLSIVSGSGGNSGGGGGYSSGTSSQNNSVGDQSSSDSIGGR